MISNQFIALIVGIVILIVVASVGWQISRTAVSPESQTSSLGQTQGASATSTTLQEYAMSDVATHKDVSSCWSVIDDSVYDLTLWVGEHPGGRQAIVRLCGKDGSEAFHGQHGERQTQKEILATMKIGTLKK